MDQGAAGSEVEADTRANREVATAQLAHLDGAVCAAATVEFVLAGAATEGVHQRLFHQARIQARAHACTLDGGWPALVAVGAFDHPCGGELDGAEVVRLNA